MTLICGIPNAGKSTYSAGYEEVIHYDSLNLTTADRHAHIIDRAVENDGICVDGVYGERWRRVELVKACKERGIECTCIWLDTPLDVCVMREDRGRHISLMRCYADTFEPPTMDEGWDTIIVIKGYTDGME